MSPAVPADARNGLAMRAGTSVEALHRHHDLTVAVVRSPYDTSPFDWVEQHAASVIDRCCTDDRLAAMSWMASERGRRVLSGGLPWLARLRPPALGDDLVEAVGTGFDAAVLMGTYAAGLAIPFLEAGVPCVLDAFDDDAATCASLGRLDPAMLDEVPLFEAFQREVFPWFERVSFASLDDAVAPFVHLPNAVAVPERRHTTAGSSPLRLLFVGHAGYAPNADALARLHERIVPAVRARGLEVELVHPGPDDDVTDAYRVAHLAVVPLRAGGGTRIKILEAFAHGCPVVATPTGAAGLGIEPGRHLVVTDDDEDDDAGVQAIVDLARDERRRERLAAEGRAFVERHHDRREVGERLVAMVDQVIASAGAR